MVSNNYDVVVVGSGLGGLGTGAILAAKERKRVLVLERESFIGGRVVSFYGKDNQLWINNKRYSYRDLQKALASTGTFITHDRPDFEQVVKKGWFNYCINDGGHGLFWGDKSRISLLCKFLGNPIYMKINKGFAVIDNKEQTKWYQVEYGKPYEWLSDGGKATRKLLMEMANWSFEQIELAKGSLGDYLRERNCSEENWLFIRNLFGSQTAMANPDDMHLRDFVKYQAIIKDIKMDLVTGSVGQIDAGIGTIDMAVQLAKAVTDNGGDILTESAVEEVIILNKKVKGVRIRTKKGAEMFDAPVVVCNIPPKQAFQVIPASNFPQDFVQEVNEKYYIPGLLTGFFYSERDFVREKGIDPRSFIFLPGVTKKKGLEALDFVMASFSWWANHSPNGLNSLEFSIPLMCREMHDKNMVNACIEEVERFMGDNWPTWRKDVKFQMWTAGAQAYGHWRPIGKDRPNTRCPWVDGLYFVGDQYGEKLWGGGVDAAALSAALCADAICSKDYEKQIFPIYHRSSW